jgi:DNA-directed RNA polymerase specialized sigma24 family protein
MPHPTPTAAAHHGDETQLFERHAAALRVSVTRAVRTSPENVEDACSFAWLQLLRTRRVVAHPFAWLRTTAIRQAVQLEQRGPRTLSLEPDELPPLADPRQDFDRRVEEVLLARAALSGARLRPREARLVGLRVCGYDRRSMAELTGDSQRTVDRQLVRAQRKLATARRAQREQVR